MAQNGKGKTSSSGGKKAEGSSGWNMDAVPEALREAGKRAAELSQNPYARSLLAAGLVAAAAALASNKNVREATRRNVKAAADAAEVGAENAGKIGIAIVNAATDAVQRMLNLSAGLATAAEAVEESVAKVQPATGKAAPKKGTGRSAASKSSAPKPAKTGGAAMTTSRPAKAASATKAASKSGSTGSPRPASSGKSNAKAPTKRGSSGGGGAARKPAPSKSS